MLLLAACITPTDTGPAKGVATWEPSCGPDDGATTEFRLDADTCEITTTAPRATLMTDTRSFAAGDHFSIADDSLYAWWGGDQPTPTAATLDILAVDGDVLTFAWSIDEESGEAEAPYCERPDLVCG